MDEKEAYRAVFYFFEQLGAENRDSLISTIHGSMQLLPNGAPADSAIENDWNEAFNKVRDLDYGNVDSETVYEAAHNLIKLLYDDNVAKPQELKDLIERIDNCESRVREYWAKALDRAKNDEEGVKLKFV